MFNCNHDGAEVVTVIDKTTSSRAKLCGTCVKAVRDNPDDPRTIETETDRLYKELAPFYINPLAERMQAHGFILQNTGGNCTAFIRNDGQIEEVITVRNDPAAPDSLDDEVELGTQAIDDDEDTAVDVTLTNMRDVLAALDNPSDEYALLSLRIWNDFHKGATK